MILASSVIRIFPTVRRALLLLAILGALGVPVAYAQESTTTGETTTDQPTTDGTTTGGTTTVGTTTGVEEPPPPPPPPLIVPESVTVAGVMIGGLTPDEARLALQGFFRRPLVLAFRGQQREPTPWRVGARAKIGLAVTRALAAAPGEALTLPVRFDREELRAYVTRLRRAWSKAPVNSTVRLRNLRPYVTKAHDGYRILRRATRLAIRSALIAHESGPLAVPYRVLQPKITRRNFGPVIVVRRGSRGLYLYRGSEFRRYFRVAVGLPEYPTPLGRFYIATMQRNPWWYPPDAGWAAGASPIPPGPGNPLGTRWMGLSIGGVGIHGTPDAASIGYAASHGCIRMRIADAEALFERVRVGTPVFIVSA
jgi:L,D-transpeptidase catalytic domain/Putative peptidoglycan binding domain